MKHFLVLLLGILCISSLSFAQNPEPAGWFAGDMHVHRSCGNAPVSIPTIYEKMADQNLAAVSLLADMGNGEVQTPVLDLPRVNGSDDPISTSGRIVHWDAEWHWDATYTQYPHQALGGHVVALGLTEAHQIWDESSHNILEWAHSQNAIGGFAHMQYLDGGFPQTLSCCTPVEYPVEVALGAADFVSEDVAGSEFAIAAYYRLLNSGFRPGFAAGTDYPCNDGVTIGSPLTYARVANGQMTYRNWIDAISSGKTVVSRNGHNEFLDLVVNSSAGPGDQIDLATGGTVQARVEWTANSALTGTIELVSNGAVVASKLASVSSGSSDTLTATVDFPKSGWLAARRMDSNGHVTHTAAIFVIVNGAPIRVNTTDPQFYVEWMNNLLANTSPGGIWNSYFPTSLATVQARYQDAKALYQQIAAEAQGTAATLSTITVTPGNSTVPSGTTQQFTATGTYSDGHSVNITGQVTWASSNASVASINTRGLAAATNTGTTTISAVFGGVTGSTLLTVETPPLKITTQTLASGVTDIPYSGKLAATGGTVPYSWSVANGSLPTGLALDAGTGVISGIPTVAGTFSLTIQAVDSATPSHIATKPFDILISSASACPCSIWPNTSSPTTDDSGPDSPLELGVKFQADTDGNILGVRFYKGLGNTGTHIGSLWTTSGTLLATATFNNETSSGWQEVTFSRPIAIKANTAYVASYHTNVGHYAADQNYFALQGTDNPPLHALKDGINGVNGLYMYGNSTVFPVAGYNASNYWVDALFVPTGPDTTAPTVVSVVPSANSTDIDLYASLSANFSESLDASTVTTHSFQLLDPLGVLVPASVTYDASTDTAKLVPLSILAPSATYTVVLKGGAIKDLAGNALASDYNWSFTTGTAPAPLANDGPGGPILVVSSSANPFSRYYGEILRAEGMNEFLMTDISFVSGETLGQYDLVILGDMALTPSQATMFADWVNAGGNLIAMHPDKQLANLLGLGESTATLSDGYLLMNANSGPGVGLVSQTIQFHGSADLYTLNGATALATLYSSATLGTASPAVTLNRVGLGQAAAFTYDLARSIVYTRQGNPAWGAQRRDNQSGPIRADNLFFGNANFDPAPDYVDLTKVAIPQADEQQRLLANLVLQMNQAKRPMPRFWYFPRFLKAVVVMTGDDHGAQYEGGKTAERFDHYNSLSPAGCSVADWQCVRASAYLLPPTIVGNSLTDSQAVSYIAQGFDVGFHADSMPICTDWTRTELSFLYSSEIASFMAQYPDVPSPKTHRMHCVSWSDYDSQPQIELQNGIRLDTNYYYWPGEWIANRPGLFTGSGMPMRFTKRDGTLLDIYQAVTQMTDESGQSFPYTIDTLLDNAVGQLGYYGAFTANMHHDQAVSPDADAIIASAQARGVPVVSAAQLLTWLDGRNGSSFGSLNWNGYALSFTVSVAEQAHGLTAMLPFNSATGPIRSLTYNGTPATYSVETIKGVKYILFSAAAGGYEATYDRMPVASEQTVQTSYNTPAEVVLTATDPDNDSVTYTVLAQPTHGTLTGTAPNLTYTPTHNYFGSDSFTFKVNDGMLDSVSATVTIAVAPPPPNAVLATTPLTFDTLVVTKTSAAQTVTLSNTGEGVLSISNIGLTGTNPTDFTQGNTCGSTLASNASCTISLRFAPIASGERAATLEVNSNDPSNPQFAVALTGNGADLATIVSPAAGTVFTTPTATFTWTPGINVQKTWMWVGITVGGRELLDFGGNGTTTTTINNLPNAGAVYVRIWSQVNGALFFNDYTYSAAGEPVPASMISPTPGSSLSGTTATFTWSPGTGVSRTYLWIGSIPGGKDLLDFGGGSANTVTVSNLPTAGSVYVRLWSEIHGVLQYTDYTYTAASAVVPAAITSPTPGSTLSGGTATFTWTPGTGVANTWIWIGTSSGGRELLDFGGHGATTVTVNNLPSAGGVYVRLWSLINGVFQYTDYAYTASGSSVPAAMISPTPGSVLSGSATFNWTPGTGVQRTWLWVGISVGGKELLDFGGNGATSVTINNIPGGGTVYVRLWSEILGVLHYTDYTYSTSAPAIPAALISPTPGTAISGGTTTFTWTPGAGVAKTWIWIGTAPGARNIADFGGNGATTVTANLPTASTIYVRLWSQINGVLQSVDYSYPTQ